MEYSYMPISPSLQLEPSMARNYSYSYTWCQKPPWETAMSPSGTKYGQLLQLQLHPSAASVSQACLSLRWEVSLTQHFRGLLDSITIVWLLQGCGNLGIQGSPLQEIRSPSTGFFRRLSFEQETVVSMHCIIFFNCSYTKRGVSLFQLN